MKKIEFSVKNENIPNEKMRSKHAIKEEVTAIWFEKKCFSPLDIICYTSHFLLCRRRMNAAKETSDGNFIIYLIEKIQTSSVCCLSHGISTLKKKLVRNNPFSMTIV